MTKAMTDVLLIAACGLAQAQSPPSTVRIEGPTTLLPGEFPEWRVSWQGGSEPWTVDFVADDAGVERAQQFVFPNSASACDADGCRTFPFGGFSYTVPQISELRASVTDGQGRRAAAPAIRLRVAGEGPIFRRGDLRMAVRQDPNAQDRFLCRSDSEADPDYLSIDGDARFPTFNWLDDVRVAAPYFLRVTGQRRWGGDFSQLGLLYGIADLHWEGSSEPPEGQDISLGFPLVFGDYTAADSRAYSELPAFPDPQVPSPPLQQGVEYLVGLPTPFECSDLSQTRFLPIYVNPPEAGAAVLGSDDTASPAGSLGTMVDGEALGGNLYTLLRERSDQVRLAAGRRLFAACIGRSLQHRLLIDLRNATARSTLDEQPEDVGSALFTFLFETRPATPDDPSPRSGIDIVREYCRDQLALPAPPGTVPTATAPARLLLASGLVLAGSEDPIATLTLATPRLQFRLPDGSHAVLGHNEDGSSLAEAVDQPLLILDADGDTTLLTLQPGQQLALDLGGTPTLRATAVFAGGFEVP